MYDVALARAEQFGIPGVTLSLTQGVVKNIVPAIPSTNAVVAAMCALEAVKIATCFCGGLNNTTVFNGTRGVYTHTVAYDRDPCCPVCSPGVPLALARGSTLQALVDALLRRYPDRLALPSVSHGARPLYVRGVFEEETRPNLGRAMEELLQEGLEGEGGEGGEGGAGERRTPPTAATLLVNDKKMAGTLRVALTLVAPE